MINIDDLILESERELSSVFHELDEISLYNQRKVLDILREEKLTSTDFNWTTGYGYGDVGRDKLESIYAKIFKSEDSLVRPNLVSGTHAISLVLNALTEYGDEILSITDRPYDTLQKVIGIEGNEPRNLLSRGRKYRELPLKNGNIDYDEIKNVITEKTKLIIFQRSTGYSNRRAFTIDELEKGVCEVKKYTHVPVFLDNCYGEFTERKEPIEIGFDIIAGSLIKNPGGGLALTGGYIAGKRHLIRSVAATLTAPGIEKECGLSFGQTRNNLMGLFLAPQRVNHCLKGAILFSKVFEKLGYKCIPSSKDPRSDIVQSIQLNDPDKLISFCRAIQEISPVDSFVVPYPWDMPGYEDKVIMAAGGFVEGSSIELSADGPLREPFTVYFQGGLTYFHCKIALENVLKNFI